MFGGAPFGGAPWGGAKAIPAGALAPFDTYLAQTERDDIYILQAFPLVGDGIDFGTPIEILYANREWIGKPAIPVRLQRALEITGSLSSAFAVPGGGGVPQVGSIRIQGQSNRDDDRLDIAANLDQRAWDGALVKILLGAPHFSFAQFQPVFVGRAIDMIRDDLGREIIVADPSLRLEVPFFTGTSLYAGTGGIEGDARLANTSRPYAAGIVRNAEPVLIDRVNNIYQWSDVQSQSLDALYEDAEEAFIDDGAVADIFAGTPPIAGHYRYELARSLFQLGAPAAGRITFDAHGDSSGSGYIETVADIVQRVCRDRAGFTDADFALASFAQLNTDLPAPIGVYLRAGVNPTVSALVYQLVGGQGDTVGVPLGFLGFNRLGELQVGVHKFRTPVVTIREDKAEIVSIERARTETPFWEWVFGYRRCWSVQAAEDIKTIPPVLAAQADFVSQEFRSVKSQNFLTPVAHPLAQSGALNTLLDDEADAQSEADRARDLTSVNRDFFEVEVANHSWRIRLGDTVHLTATERWNIDRDFLVLNLGENTSTGFTRLGLWG